MKAPSEEIYCKSTQGTFKSMALSSFV